MWPTATFVNYIHAIKITHNLGGYVYDLLRFLHMWPVNQPTVRIMTLCQKTLDIPALKKMFILKYERGK
jgi:hypothetical protein